MLIVTGIQSPAGNPQVQKRDCGPAIDICGNAFLLIPCDDDHPGIEGCDYSLDANNIASVPVPPAFARAKRDFLVGIYSDHRIIAGVNWGVSVLKLPQYPPATLLCHSLPSTLSRLRFTLSRR